MGKRVDIKAILIFLDKRVIVDKLSDQDAGLLFKSLFKYALEGVEPELKENPALDMAFSIFKQSIDLNEKHYKEVCKKRSESAKKRWDNTNDTNASICIQEPTNDSKHKIINKTINKTSTKPKTKRKPNIILT